MSNGIYCIKFCGARRNMAACGRISSPKAMKLDEKKQSRKSCKYELQFICCDDILSVQL